MKKTWARRMNRITSSLNSMEVKPLRKTWRMLATTATVTRGQISPRLILRVASLFSFSSRAGTLGRIISKLMGLLSLA